MLSAIISHSLSGCPAHTLSAVKYLLLITHLLILICLYGQIAVAPSHHPVGLCLYTLSHSFLNNLIYFHPEPIGLAHKVMTHGNVWALDGIAGGWMLSKKTKLSYRFLTLNPPGSTHCIAF